MGSLKDTKRRITSVKNTQKITKAMKLVSAAKFAKANSCLQSIRPYNEAFDRIVGRVLSGTEIKKNKLAEVRQVRRSLVVLMMPDKGLCGGLNSNIIKKADALVKSLSKDSVEIDLVQWGLRGKVLASKNPIKVVSSREKVLEKPIYKFAKEVTGFMISEFEQEKYDSVFAIYPRFVNAMVQIPEVTSLLPCLSEDYKKESKDDLFVFEPSCEKLLDSLLRKQLANKVFRMMLEGSASEHAARMTAMDNATNNADEVVKRLTLEYNRGRQAAITTELIEITSGAEAL